MRPERNETDRLAVGLSGGADSVALLLMLRERHGGGLLAVHVHHGIRGEAADGDERFCRELCAREGIPLRVERLDLGPDCSEDRARQARYAALRRVCAEEGITRLALAHHMDDQAETLLLRLIRGSGTAGLGAMAAESEWYGLTVLRPLLGFAREALRRWLRERGQDWREDESNADPRYLRSRVRTELLPLMESMNPGMAARLSRTAALLREDEDMLTASAEALLLQDGGPRWLRAEALTAAQPPVQSRALRLWWERAHGLELPEHTLSYEQTLGLRALAGAPSGTGRNLPDGWRAVRGAHFLHLVPPDTEPDEPLPLRETRSLNGLTVSLTARQGEEADGKRTAVLPPETADRCVLRTPRPGDVITPEHSGHARPLREFLRARGVETPFRRWIPVLCSGSEVLMVPGLGRSEQLARAADGLLLRWTGPMPWTNDRTGEEDNG